MSWWQYLLLVNLYLVLFYGFYAVLLRSETFFHLNRIYLVSSALFAFFIPVIHYDWVRNLFITQQVQHTIAVYSAPILVYHFKPIEEHHITVGQMLLFIYAVGSCILVGRFIWQLVSLKRIIDEPETTSAFSFFKSIRLGTNPDNKEVIEAHEQVHVRQWHSADVLLMEAIAIINWFNPVVYLYKFGIKHIHEFIADRQALENGTDKAEYALLLLSQTLKAPAHELVTPFFNHSLLKQRIIMLQKGRSRRTALLKYGLSAPLFVLMMILSAATIGKIKAVKMFFNKTEAVFSAPVMAPMSQGHIVKKKEIVESEPSIQPELGERPDMSELPTRKIENTSAAPVGEPIFITVEKEPEFKGGSSEFYRFLKRNLKYPEAMLRNNIQGKVIISLTVEKDGTLSGIKSVKDIGFGAGDEAIRVLELSPNWEPGYQNGHTVRVNYTLPISFKIDNLKPVDTVSEAVYEVKNTKATTYSVTPSDTTKRYSTTLIGLDPQMKPIYVLDGKEIPNLEGVDPESIESVYVIKKKPQIDTYVAQFGSKALSGVVAIKTKKGLSAH
jgi:TonB family protein